MIEGNLRKNLIFRSVWQESGVAYVSLKGRVISISYQAIA